MMKKTPIGYFKKVAESQRSYFAECGREIAVRNLQLMRTVGYVVTCVYALYFAVTELFFEQWAISPLYALIAPVMLGFIVYAKKALAAEAVRTKEALRATLALNILLLLYIISMSVFPHPDVPSAYYPLFLMMAPVMLILPAVQHLMMTAFSLVVFYALVIAFKSPACWSHELFEATTAAVFSVVVIVFMTQYRLQSDSLKSKYYELSRRDPLTGTANKSAGEAVVEEYAAGMRDDENGAMLLLDIDDFKRFNDDDGHLEGDRLLKAVGSTLLALCRKDDVVYRFGGDEFSILLKDIQSPDVAVQKARGVIDAIAGITSGDGRPLTCSIGVSCCRRGCTGREMIRRADAALYCAKRKGKSRFEVWRADVDGDPQA